VLHTFPTDREYELKDRTWENDHYIEWSGPAGTAEALTDEQAAEWLLVHGQRLPVELQRHAESLPAGKVRDGGVITLDVFGPLTTMQGRLCQLLHKAGDKGLTLHQVARELYKSAAPGKIKALEGLKERTNAVFAAKRIPFYINREDGRLYLIPQNGPTPA
jgi:hypothetical protein